MATYSSCESAPSLGPSRTAARAVKRNWSVIGAGPIGTLINAPTAVKAAKNETKIIFLVLIFICILRCKFYVNNIIQKRSIVNHF
jgi:hypothetical protein